MCQGLHGECSGELWGARPEDIKLSSSITVSQQTLQQPGNILQVSQNVLWNIRNISEPFPSLVQWLSFKGSDFILRRSYVASIWIQNVCTACVIRKDQATNTATRYPLQTKVLECEGKKDLGKYFKKWNFICIKKIGAEMDLVLSASICAYLHLLRSRTCVWQTKHHQATNSTAHHKDKDHSTKMFKLKKGFVMNLEDVVLNTADTRLNRKVLSSEWAIYGTATPFHDNSLEVVDGGQMKAAELWQ